jgi:hypothetical protein
MNIEIIRRYLPLALILLLLASILLTGCGGGLQTFNKHGISFKVSGELKLEEYAVNFEKQTFRRGAVSYEQGAVLSTEKNFMFLWLTTVPQFSPAEVRSSILSTPNSFESASGTFKAEIAGDLVKQQVSGFEVTSARMQFSMPGWKVPGITAVWYCADSHRTMQVVLIHKQPETELKRFIGSFSSTPRN